MRNKRLDILRAVAVLLVIGRHGPVEGVWKWVGWTGVDLFFVLSGFLISGLLFAEYKKRRQIGLSRFFIRRGLKIYPAFYAMLLCTLFVKAVYGPLPVFEQWVREIFFFQNYKFGIWDHTWSLAVEEHFYLFLPLLLLALVKLSRNRSNPFEALPVVFGVLAGVVLGMRVWNAYQPGFLPAQFPKVMFPTHLRIDALFFGVLLGYLHHFRPGFLPRLLESRRNRLGIELIAALLISACFVFDLESRFMLAFGFTLLYLGFGGLLALALYSEPSRNDSPGRGRAAMSRLGDALAYMGMYSYSIYLWHLMVERYGLRALRSFVPAVQSAVLLFILYAVASIVLGIVLARTIEFPVLRLRDRIFPSSVPAAGVAREAHADVSAPKPSPVGVA